MHTELREDAKVEEEREMIYLPSMIRESWMQIIDDETRSGTECTEVR